MIKAIDDEQSRHYITEKAHYTTHSWFCGQLPTIFESPPTISHLSHLPPIFSTNLPLSTYCHTPHNAGRSKYTAEVSIQDPVEQIPMYSCESCTLTQTQEILLDGTYTTIMPTSSVCLARSHQQPGRARLPPADRHILETTSSSSGKSRDTS